MSIVIGNNTISSIQIGNKTVERIEIDGKTAYELPDYLCFTDASGSSNTLTLTKNGNAPTVSLEYSTDKVNWTTWTENNGVRTYTIPANGKVYLRGVNSNGTGTNETDCHVFSSTKDVNASGNVVTILDGVGINTDNIHLSRLFFGMTTLKTAPSFPNGGLVLGSNALCQMYDGCTGLTTTPAFTVSSFTGNAAMYYMFNGCIGLTSASNIHLNATNIPQSTYFYTFCDCSSLTELPVFTSSPLSVGHAGMRCMFYKCISLTTAPSFTISSMSGLYTYSSMFQGCTSLTTASNIRLHATTIPDYAYTQMFYSCASLTTPPTMTSSALTIGVSGLNSMFSYCSALTSTPTITIGSLVSGTKSHCINMFNGCTSLKTANMQLNATTLYDGSYKQMFNGCASLVNAPEIKATTLSDGGGDTNNGSLAYMFSGCSKLTYIKVNFTDWNSGNCTKDWTYGTKSTGTFYKPSSLESTKNASGNTSNANYIPYDWTVTNI